MSLVEPSSHKRARSRSPTPISRFKAKVRKSTTDIATANVAEMADRANLAEPSQTLEEFNGDSESQAKLVRIVHETVRRLIGMPTPDYQGNLSPCKWPDPEPASKDGKITDPVSGQEVWRPNWGKLNSIPTKNFIVHAVVACQQHPLHGPCMTESIVEDKVRKYIQSIHKGRKKTPERKEAKNDRRTIRERQRRLQDFIKKHFDETPLNRCRERKILREAFKPHGILSTIRIVHYSQTLQHNLRTGGELTSENKDAPIGTLDGALQSVTRSGPTSFDEFQLYTDAWWGEVSSSFYLSLDVWWWSELASLSIRWAVWTVYECYRASSVSTDRPPPIHMPIEKIDLSYGFHLLTPNSAQLNGNSPSSSWPYIWACPAMIDYPTVNTLNPSCIPSADTLFPDPILDLEDTHLPSLTDVLKQPEQQKLMSAISRHFKHPRLLSDDQLKDLWALRQDQEKRREYEFALQSMTGEAKMRSMEGVSPLLKGLEEGLEVNMGPISSTERPIKSKPLLSPTHLIESHGSETEVTLHALEQIASVTNEIEQPLLMTDPNLQGDIVGPPFAMLAQNVAEGTDEKLVPVEGAPPPATTLQEAFARGFSTHEGKKI
nr:hypothetical protein L204_00896 [Cryptococcus depauperatus CBS 7855]